MYKKNLIFILGFIFLILSFTNLWAEESSYQTYNLGLEAGVWAPSITGSLKFGNSTKVDLISDLAMSNSSAINFGMQYNLSPQVNWQLYYFDLGNTGSKSIVNQFNWRFRNFAVGDIVNSSLKVRMLDVLYEKNLYRLPEGELNVDLGLKFGSFDVSLNDTTQSFTVSQSLSGFMPQVGFSGKMKITETLDGFSRFYFIKADSSGRTAGMVDLISGLKWNFYNNWSADLAYKWFQLTGKNNLSQDEINFNYGGPLAQIRYNF
ncbi:MAG: hypothetical protein HYU63_08085 [Armatimonadetes bacterium]|nr:hypothetical protein [Armatimonadota bacterium]